VQPSTTPKAAKTDNQDSKINDKKEQNHPSNNNDDVKAGESRASISGDDLIQFAESVLSDAKGVLQTGPRTVESSVLNGRKSNNNSNSNNAQEGQESYVVDESTRLIAEAAEVARQEECLRKTGSAKNTKEEDEDGRWTDSEPEVGEDAIRGDNIEEKVNSGGTVLDASKGDVSGGGGIVQDKAIIQRVEDDKLDAWSSTSSNVSPRGKTPTTNLGAGIANLTKEVETDADANDNSESGASSWSESGDIEGPREIKSSNKKLAAAGTLKENKEMPAEVLFLPMKKESWTNPSYSVRDQEKPVVPQKEKCQDKSVYLSSSSEEDEGNLHQGNIPAPSKSAGPSKNLTPDVKEQEIAGEGRNEVRLARVTSSEIFGELELEVEINPFTKHLKNSSAGQGDSVFDPFKVPSSNTTTDKTDSKNEKLQDRKDSVPYSALLLGNKNTVQKQLAKASKSTDKKLKLPKGTTKGSKSVDSLASGTHSSLATTSDVPSELDLSAASVQEKVKKPFFTRLKRKISKTLTKSSLLHLSMSLPTLSEDVEKQVDMAEDVNFVEEKNGESIRESESSRNHHCSSSQQDDDNDNIPVSRAILSEHRCFKLLLEAKEILNSVLTPDEKLDIQQQLLLSSLHTVESNDSINLSGGENPLDAVIPNEIEVDENQQSIINKGLIFSESAES
jgi:hypothetical protein